MSTKASPPTSSAGVTAAATNSSLSTSSTLATTGGGASGAVIKIKSELPSDEIKEYAENTMNELLGWYGFDGVDRLDLSSKASRLLHSSSNSVSNTMSHHQMEKRRSRNRAAALLNVQQHNVRNNNNNNNNSVTNNNNNNNNTYSSIRMNNIKNNLLNNNNNNNNNNLTSNANSYHSHNTGLSGGGNESTTSDHDTRSSREDDSKSPHSAGKTTIEEKIDYNNCCWCRRTVPENAPEFLTTTDGPRYCSESCFTQSRRASFKKAKTCDWCKHVRHAVSYVDFQDGASQLQFCSDKCLNQYKMQIFCKETQAHLDMNPHLREQGLEAAASGNGAGLITPDLWLRNCRSRSASPASTLSVSPAPPTTSLSTISAPIVRLSPPPMSQSSTEHKPMISVTPTAKLMSKSPGVISSNRQSPKHNRKKRPLRSSMGSTDAGISVKSNHNNLRREINNSLGGGSNHLHNSSKSLLNLNKPNSLRTSPGQTSIANSSSSSLKLPSTPSLSQFAASSVQDLHMSVPPLSPMLDQQLPPPPPQQLPVRTPHPDVGIRTSIPSAFFATPPGGPQHGSMPHQATPQLAAGFPTRPPFLQNPPLSGAIPRFMSTMGFPPLQHPPAIQPDMCGFPSFLGAPPPVTVMVPYPIIIPLPIPIPIPLPIIDFYKAHLTPEQRQRMKEEQQEERENAEREQQREIAVDVAPMESQSSEMDNGNGSDEPLDCTKTRESPTTFVKNVPATPNIETVNKHPEDQQRLTMDSEPADVSMTEEKSTHHIITTIQPTEPLTQSSCTAASNNPDDPNNPNEEEINQKLPKLKITRLHTKRTLLQTKESECSRPLRKRKRIIDCDFQKIALNNKESEQEELDNLNAVAMSSQTKSSSSKK